jgi:formylglycine-generating enzyme required for sulfatase activity
MQHDPSDPDRTSPECCVADGENRDAALPENPCGETSAATTDTARMVEIAAGRFEMGTDDDVGFPADGEGPRRAVDLDAFYVDRHLVANAEFAQSVGDTGDTTDAERFDWSFVFRDFVGPKQRPHVLDAIDPASWWLAVEGANWLRPEAGVVGHRGPAETPRRPRVRDVQRRGERPGVVCRLANWLTADPPEGPLANPTGSAEGAGTVSRGGSSLCHDSYRIPRRRTEFDRPDERTGNCGFRRAVDARAAARVDPRATRSSRTGRVYTSTSTS